MNMDNKVTLQDLADGLARRRGITQDEATTFVKCVFDIVEQYISSDKLVKIKGLGTFKLVTVSNRESVNVNTGERILIQGHTKVSFLPDSGIADLVNKPFADFETTILNDNIDMEALDNIVTPDLPMPASNVAQEDTDTEEVVLEDEEESPTVDFTSEEPEVASAETEEIATAQEPVESELMPVESEASPTDVTEIETPSEEPVTDDENSAETETVEVSEPAVVTEATEPGSAITEKSPVEPVADTQNCTEASEPQNEATIHQQVEVLKTQTQNVQSQQVSDLNVSTQHVEHQTIEQHVSSADGKSQEDSNHSVLHVSWRGVMALIIMVVILMIGSYLAGYYELLSPVKTPRVPDVQPTVPTERVAAKPAPVVPKAVADSTKAKKETAVEAENQTVEEKPAEEVAEQKVPEVEPEKKEVVAQEPAPKAKDSVVEPVKEAPKQEVKPAVPEKAKEPTIPSEQQETLVTQVRGSYKIVGTRGTHVVRDGDNISSIARATYGDPRMATYIIAYNNLSNPDIITAGTQLKLPELRQKQ